MSRDQRPGRAVMVDSVRPVINAGRDAVAGDGDAPMVPAPPVAGRPGLLLPALVFLLACAGGAVATALLLRAGWL